VDGLSFVTISQVRSLDDILLQPFAFSRLEHIKNCKRLKEHLAEEKRLAEMKVTV